MNAALKAQLANDLDEAQRLYHQALELSPQNIDALHMLGVVHFSKGELHLAESLISSAEAVCERPIPAIEKNLALVRAARKFSRGERVIQSLLASRDLQQRMGLVGADDARCEQTTRLIAFYLPQFHRIPENDQWWGEGFTEWVNVRRARPNFEGHYQPHEPGELGYYDLSDEQILIRQAALAKEYGISGFCFYYYWFSGRQLLEMPLDRLFRTGQPDFPYCLCWANENWSRNWDGGNQSILIEQRYLPTDPENFILSTLPHFRDRRYIRVNNRPLLMVYRVELIPDPAATFDTWRTVCARNGMEPPYIVLASTFGDEKSPFEVHADAISEFPPHAANVTLALRTRLKGLSPEFKGHLVSYYQNIANFLTRPKPDYPYFPGIVPSWDNTARRQNDGVCMLDSNPAAFELWLRELVFRASFNPDPDERIVFINAWNEWAEGCHLEPDRHHGRAWLEACRNARLIPGHYQGVFGSPAAAAPRAGRLRTQDLPMIDMQRLPAAPAPALTGAPQDDCVITLVEGGDALPTAPLLQREKLPDRLVKEHDAPFPASAVEVYCVADVMLHGPAWVGREDGVLFDPSIYPTYTRTLYREGRVFNAVDVDLSQLRPLQFEAGWHVAHFNCGTYGHWLCEVLPKLLTISEFLRRWPEYGPLPIFLPSVFPEFVYAHTQAVLPYVPIVIYDPRFEYIACKWMFMPTCDPNLAYNPWLRGQLDRMQLTPDPGIPPRLFVTRRRTSTVRALENLHEIEAIAQEEGLALYYPNERPLPAQIAAFRNAKVIAGEYGSALHNAIFSPAGTAVVALNWMNSYQSRIARFRGHRVGFLLPTSGAAVMYEYGAPMQRYAIDPDAFRAMLREALAPPATAA